MTIKDERETNEDVASKVRHRRRHKKGMGTDRKNEE